MNSPRRNAPWKQVIREYGRGFVQWANENGVAYRFFDALASDLERYLLNALSACSRYEMDEQECYQEFVAAIPKVLARCDDNIYDHVLVAEAYAYVHLLERYRRFWSLLVELTKHGILPMRDTGVEVLDVGTGPAPALFAVDDFYRALGEYAQIAAIPVLDVPPPKMHSVESSYPMVHVAHNIAEYSGKRGPFRATFTNFDALDLNEARLSFRDELQHQLDDELGPWMSYPVSEGDWQGKFRYNLIIFSNFLTEPERVAELEQAIREVFYSLRAGGIVVVVGGTEAHYPQIYAMLEKLALDSGIQLMSRVARVIPCEYSDSFAYRIKQSYSKVWSFLEEHFKGLVHLQAGIPADLWNPDVALKGPRQFGLRVFRKVWASSSQRSIRASAYP